MKLGGTELKKKIVSVLESKILIDATILYQSLGDLRK